MVRLVCCALGLALAGCPVETELETIEPDGELIAGHQPSPRKLVVHEGQPYWLAGTSVRTIDESGDVQVVAERYSDFSFGADFLLLASEELIQQRGDDSVVVSEEGPFQYVEAHGECSFWIVGDSGNARYPATLGTSGCGAEPRDVTLLEHEHALTHIAVDSANVYTSRGTEVVAIDRQNLDVRVLFDADSLHESGRIGSPSEFVLDEDSLYATLNNQGGSPTGAVVRYHKASGETEVLTLDDLNPLGIAIDTEFVYWTRNKRNRFVPGQSTGAIVRIPKSGGAPEVIAGGQAGPVSVAVSDGTVYWVNNETREVRKLDLNSP